MSVVTRSGPQTRHVQQDHLAVQMALLFFILAVSTLVSATAVTDGLWPTLALLAGVAFLGLLLITRLRHQLGDPNLQKLGYVFLIKLLIVVFFVRFGWLPELETYTATWGGDPARYYHAAAEWVRSGFFSLSAIPSLNYTGILIYYGSIFAVFGHNPVGPALINVFVTLLATIVLIRVGYQIRQQRSSHDWMLGLCMIVPEVLWFDVVTSRETLTMALIIITVLPVGGYFIQTPDGHGPRWSLVGMIPALLLLGIVRPPMLVPVVASLSLFFIRSHLPGRRRLVGFVLVSLAVVVLLIIPTLLPTLQSYDIDYYGSRFDLMTNIEEVRSSSGLSWSGRSIGQVLIPDSWAETVIFAPIRLLVYLIAPLPNVSIDLTGLVKGSWNAWQDLMMQLSSLLNLVLFPLVLVSLFEIVREKRWTNGLLLHIPFWLTFGAIAISTLIIHLRYRVMIAVLLWGCAWLGLSGDRQQIRRSYAIWVAVLLAGGGVFVAYKYFL